MLSLTEVISSLPSLKATVDAHNLMAAKSLGQNFLLDQNITDKIIRCSLSQQELSNFHGSHVYEIGPGPGGLTRAILKAEPNKLTVIEMDARCISIMEDIQRKTEDIMEIVNGDALKYEFTPQYRAAHIISNLPYNISVPLLIRWLNQISEFKSLTLMFQKEVADRILSSTHTKSYGRISILSQLQCNITRLFDLSPECFVPAPKIWSSVLLFQPKKNALSPKQISQLERLTSLAFSARRKMIRQSLKQIPNIEEICQTLGIATTARPEELSPQQFLSIANAIQNY